MPGTFLQLMQGMTGNLPGEDGLITFPDSSWLGSTQGLLRGCVPQETRCKIARLQGDGGSLGPGQKHELAGVETRVTPGGERLADAADRACQRQGCRDGVGDRPVLAHVLVQKLEALIVLMGVDDQLVVHGDHLRRGVLANAV